MRIGVCGDTHIGANLNYGTKNNHTGVNSRQQDYQDTLLYTIVALKERDCSHLVFTGDIFEHRNPTLKQQEFFSQALHRALELGFEEVHVVMGNHDQKRSDTTSTLAYLKELHLERIHIHDKIEVCVFNEAQVSVSFLPYRDRNFYRAAHNIEASAQLKSEVEQLQLPRGFFNLAIGHMAIEGSLQMMEKYVDLYDGNEMCIPKEWMKPWDLTVMGHIHTPGWLSKEPRIYCVGSMEKRGAFEVEDKVAVIVDTSTREMEFVTEPCRSIVELTLTVGRVEAENLMPTLIKMIDAGPSIPKEAIVKINISIAKEDEAFLAVKELQEYLKKQYQVHHMVPPKVTKIYVRQSRDASITEKVHEPEAFAIYMKSRAAQSEHEDNIAEQGMKIIRHLLNDSNKTEDK